MTEQIFKPRGRTLNWLVLFERHVATNVAALLMIFSTAVMTFEASSRVFFSQSYFWAEELVRFPMVWAFFISLGAAGRAGHMIRTEMLVDRMPPVIRRLMNIVSTALGVVFCGVLFYAAIPVITRYYTMGMKTDSSLDFPMWILFLAMPIGATLAGTYYFTILIDAIKGQDPYAPVHESSPDAAVDQKGAML